MDDPRKALESLKRRRQKINANLREAIRLVEELRPEVAADAEDDETRERMMNSLDFVVEAVRAQIDELNQAIADAEHRLNNPPPPYGDISWTSGTDD